MKFFAIILVVVQAVLIQTAYSQICTAAVPVAVSGPIIAQPSVAASLADTLSLLTVSSLLAETLPLNPNIIATVPVPTAVPGYGRCGCGYNNYCNYLY